MAFLELNGFAVPVQDGSGALTPVRQGEQSRSPGGVARTSQRDDKVELAGTTCYYDIDAAEAFEGLVSGQGHVFHFNAGLSSYTGLQPEADYAGLSVDLGAMGPNINGGLDITQGSFDLRYNAQLGDDWTIQWREFDGADWSIATMTSAGGSYLDSTSTPGVGVTATALSVEVRDGVVRLGYSGSGTLSSLTDLVVLPFVASAEMVVAFHSFLYNFSPLPLLKMSGDAVQGQTLLGYGQVVGSSYVQAGQAGGWQNNMKQVSFQLSPAEEIAEPY